MRPVQEPAQGKQRPLQKQKQTQPLRLRWKHRVHDGFDILASDTTPKAGTGNRRRVEPVLGDESTHNR